MHNTGESSENQSQPTIFVRISDKISILDSAQITGGCTPNRVPLAMWPVFLCRIVSKVVDVIGRQWTAAGEDKPVRKKK